MASYPLDPELPVDLLDAIYPLLGLLNSVRTISAGKLGILSLAAEQGKISAADMKDRLAVSQQAISVAAKELVEMGLLARDKDPADLRRTWFRLTDAGTKKLYIERAQARTILAEAISAKLGHNEQLAIRQAIPALTQISRATDEPR
ncbi:winged helix DNA-binding protein [Glutamicibacter arilaitensis]|uniref:winged helix DNA-binding protein n=1 Tax=Glutamicibacter arilaitensis TaxID=256701 RepID=UPI00384C439D